MQRKETDSTGGLASFGYMLWLVVVLLLLLLVAVLGFYLFGGLTNVCRVLIMQSNACWSGMRGGRAFRA